ncbi:mutS protein homolog 4 [Ixodes scapularis]
MSKHTAASSSLNFNAIFDPSTSGSGVLAGQTLRLGASRGRNAKATTSTLGPRRRTTTTTTSSEAVSKTVVVALVEGRGVARGEVGLASFDLRCPTLVVAQFQDDQNYTNTLMRLQILEPKELLVPKTALEPHSMGELVQLLRKELPMITVVPLDRRLFNDSAGIEYVRNLCVPEYSSIETEVVNKYYGLSAVAALVQYVEGMQNVTCTPHSIKIIFNSGKGVTRLDCTTVRELELLVNKMAPRSGASLFGILNHTRTPGGARLLRVNVLQPPCDKDAVAQRQQAVREILDEEEFFYGLQFLLDKMVDLEPLLGFLVQVPRVETQHSMELRIQSCLSLRQLLECVEPLRLLLSKAGPDSLLARYASDLQNDRYARLGEVAGVVTHSNVKYRRDSWQKVLQLCDAIKPDVNGLLDIARRTFSETYQDIQDLVEKELAEELQLPVKLAYSTTRGLYARLLYKGQPPVLPDTCVMVAATKTFLSFTTDRLVRMNERARGAIHEVSRLSSKVLESVVAEVVANVGCLYKLAEVVSNVDFLHSLTEACTLEEYVRPEFTDTLCITAGHHPILESVGKETSVPNDTFMHSYSNCCIITGPNMSGKSTYLKQVAVLQTMAQMGSFVPAKYASFRMADQIFVHAGHKEDMETNTSTFLMEMRSASYILQNFTDSSLVVIDELGRGTSEEEGAAICMAITEKLMDSDAFVILATHFDLMTQMESMYRNVTNFHMQVETEENEGCLKLQCTHRLAKGACMDRKYGLKLAEISNIPAPIVARAAQVSDQICAAFPAFSHDNPELWKLERAELELGGKLKMLAKHCKLSRPQRHAHLLELQAEAQRLRAWKQALLDTSTSAPQAASDSTMGSEE